MRDGWSRRAVFGMVAGAGVAGALSGCSWLEDEPDPEPDPDPLQPLLVATRALVARYQQVLATHPELADRLDPLYQAHRAHETALTEVTGAPATPSPTITRRWVPPPSSPPATPGTPEDVLAALGEAERAGQDEAARACLAAPPERAALLGSIAAARASHTEVLA